jgi:hypothetical protein
MGSPALTHRRGGYWFGVGDLGVHLGLGGLPRLQVAQPPAEVSAHVVGPGKNPPPPPGADGLHGHPVPGGQPEHGQERLVGGKSLVSGRNVALLSHHCP